jgi:hypothetical protein
MEEGKMADKVPAPGAEALQLSTEDSLAGTVVPYSILVRLPSWAFVAIPRVDLFG